MVASLVCGNNNVSNLISGLRNLTTITRKLPISEQSKIYEDSMIAGRNILKLSETNKNITIILGKELLNTPLPKKYNYGNALFAFETANILEKCNINLLISCVDKILDSTNWDEQAICNLLNTTLKSHMNNIHRTDLDYDVLSNLFLKAANDKRKNVKATAISGLVGSIYPLYAKNASNEYVVEPIDKINGEIIAKQTIVNAEDYYTKVHFYDILYQGGLAKSEYINYLKKEMANTNLHLFAKTQIAKKLLTIKGVDKKEVEKLKNKCKELIEKSQREAEAANYDAESKEKQKAIRQWVLEASKY